MSTAGSSRRAASIRSPTPVWGGAACIFAGGRFGKVRQPNSFIRISATHSPCISHHTIGAPVDGWIRDGAQCLAGGVGEIVFDELIRRLLRILVEHAGAGRGLLILLARR